MDAPGPCLLPTTELRLHTIPDDDDDDGDDKDDENDDSRFTPSPMPG